MCNMKRILQAVTELWPGQEYLLGQISISLWPPGGQVFQGQMCHNPQKAHLHILGVLHVQYEKNPPSGYRVTGPDKNITLTPWGTRSWGQMSHLPQKAHLDPLGVLNVQYVKNPPSGYRVMARTRIFTWANKHITLTPWGGGGVKFFGVKCVTTHKRHIYTSWGSYMCNMKRILQAVTELRAGQEYHLDPQGDKVMGSNESFPPKGTSRPPRGPTCAIWKESS